MPELNTWYAMVNILAFGILLHVAWNLGGALASFIRTGKATGGELVCVVLAVLFLLIAVLAVAL